LPQYFPHTQRREGSQTTTTINTIPHMKLSSVFTSKWLKAADLNGQARLVTIESVKLETIEQGKPAKLVVMFCGLTQGLGLNKTNANTVSSFFGDDTDDWVGKKIVLYPTQVDFQGRLIDCIRVRQPKAQTNTPAPAEGDDVPF